MERPLIVVAGVSGSGKTTVGERLADALGTPFIDGDSLHPPANVAKMAAGTPLTDDDRWPWLAVVGRTLADAGPAGMVVACSALRRAYRDAILAEAPGAVFVQLDGSHQLLEQRMDARVGHFMPPSLLRSQLALYEPLAPDEPGFRVPISGTPDEITADAIRQLSAGAGSQSSPRSQN